MNFKMDFKVIGGFENIPFYDAYYQNCDLWQPRPICYCIVRLLCGFIAMIITYFEMYTKNLSHPLRVFSSLSLNTN